MLECLISRDAGFMLMRKRPACLNTKGNAKPRYLGSSDFLHLEFWGSPSVPFSVVELPIDAGFSSKEDLCEDGEKEAKQSDPQWLLLKRVWFYGSIQGMENPPCITQMSIMLFL